MKNTLIKILPLFIICFIAACGQEKSPFYEEILKSETGQFRGAEISTTSEEIKAIEDENYLKDQMINYLHYDYEISMGNTFTVTYDFSDNNELYEIEVAIFLDEIEAAEPLFKNFSDYFNRKYSIGRTEDDGYMTWHTKSNISQNKVAISMINDSEAYGYITILIRDLDY